MQITKYIDYKVKFLKFVKMIENERIKQVNTINTLQSTNKYLSDMQIRKNTIIDLYKSTADKHSQINEMIVYSLATSSSDDDKEELYRQSLGFFEINRKELNDILERESELNEYRLWKIKGFWI